MPLVTDPLIRDTRQVLLEWDVSSTSDTVKVKTMKAHYGPGPLMTNAYGAGTVRECCLSLCVTNWPPDACGHMQPPAGRDQREPSHWSQSHALKTEHNERKNSCGLMVLLITNDTKETK